MVTYDTGDNMYVGEGIHEIVLQILEENAYKNKKFPGRDPYTQDYNLVYSSVMQGMDNISKIKNHKEKAEFAFQQKIKTRKITFRDAVNAARALVQFTAGSVVEQDEMTRRAKICSNCDLVNKNVGCATCHAGAVLSQVVNIVRTAAKRGVHYPTVAGAEAKDSNCGYCGCSSLMILPAKISVFNESEEKNAGRPDICWVKRDSPNYIPET